MAKRYHRLLLVFVDGVGLATAGPDNPLSTEEAPTLESLLGGPMTSDRVGLRRECELAALDACLGVTGLPQSATGQATLFTGVNAAARMGRHITGLPGPGLRELVRREGLLGRAAAIGRRVTFANAYSTAYRDRLDLGVARPSVTTCMAVAAGSGLRTMDDLAAGRAVTWDVVGDHFALAAGVEVEPVDPFGAGRRLAKLVVDHDLVIFETFLPDLAGHGRVKIGEREVVRRLDGLVAGIIGDAREDLTLVLTSDHGNFESRSARGHTRNQVPLLAVGADAGRFRELRSLTEVTPRLLEILGASGSGRSSPDERPGSAPSGAPR